MAVDSACRCCELGRGGTGGVGVCATCRDYFSEVEALPPVENDPEWHHRELAAIEAAHEAFHRAGGDENPAAVAAVQPIPFTRYRPSFRDREIARLYPEIAWLVGLPPDERAFYREPFNARLLIETFPQVKDAIWTRLLT